MSEKPSPDLSELTLTAARAMSGAEFVRANDSGPDVVLLLLEAECARRDPTAADSPSGRPFSLLFRGPADPQLIQGMHDLDHPDHPLPGIFLVPVGPDPDGLLYEAVFS